MTNEEKQLLLKDLCSRLYYNVKVRYYNQYVGTLISLFDLSEYKDGTKHPLISVYGDDGTPHKVKVESLKPYLRPMSSMTDKELAAFLEIRGMNLKSEELQSFRKGQISIVSTLPLYSRHIDWLNAHHFDYRGLIEKGLAIEAPKGMYNKH